MQDSHPWYSRAVKHLLAVSLLGTSVAVCAGTAPADKLFSDGYLKFKAGDYATAVDRFKSGLRLKPEDAVAHYYLGRAYRALNEDDLAVQEFEFTISLLTASTSHSGITP